MRQTTDVVFQRYAWFNSGYKFTRQITEAVFQRYAWFNSGYKFMRQTTEAVFQRCCGMYSFAELTVVSFTVPLNGLTIVVTATVVTLCSSRVFASRCRVVVEVLLSMMLTILLGTAFFRRLLGVL